MNTYNGQPTKSQRAIASQLRATAKANGYEMSLEESLAKAGYVAPKAAAVTAAKAPSKTYRPQPRRRDDCVRGWEHDVE